MPQEARLHWERADLIRDVKFDHDARRIVLKGHYPRKFDFGLGEFDLREVGDMICENVRRELHNVQEIVSLFSNTDLREVQHIPYRIQAREYQRARQCLHLWPYLLSKPFSATEAAAALAQMLLLSTEEAEESGDLGSQWCKEIHQIMEKTKSLRPFDFMIRSLCIHVSERLGMLPKHTRSAGRLKEYLMQFMGLIEENCDRLVSHALKQIRPDDVLVLYGHSVNIERLLRNIDKSHCIYIVDCYKPLGGRQIADENVTILERVKSLGFARFKFLSLASFPGALAELKRMKMPCKVLLSTHGRLKGGDLLCKVGGMMIAETANRFGAKVIALCDTTKFLVDGIEDDEIAGHGHLFSSGDHKMHPELEGVPYVAPKMDRVPVELLDKVVTEKGVETGVGGPEVGRSDTERIRSDTSSRFAVGVDREISLDNLALLLGAIAKLHRLANVEVPRIKDIEIGHELPEGAIFGEEWR
jgi:translation initiation factor 2B subunit (eIF-2B alpha/beta/delta family)